MGINHGWFSAFAANPRVRAVLFLFGVSLAESTLWSMSPSPWDFLVFIIAIIITFIIIIMVLFGAGRDLVEIRWRLLCERLILLAVIAPVMLAGGQLGDYVHLAILYPYYHQQIAQTPKRPVRFSWGDQAVTVLDGLRMRILLYDDTGATTVTAIKKQDGEGICTARQHLILNFFIEEVTAPC